LGCVDEILYMAGLNFDLDTCIHPFDCFNKLNCPNPFFTSIKNINAQGDYRWI
jgi:hypothetical protein